MSYDPKCGELAEHFLADDPMGKNKEFVEELAQHIQDSIEVWFAEVVIEMAEKGSGDSTPESQARKRP